MAHGLWYMYIISIVFTLDFDRGHHPVLDYFQFNNAYKVLYR